MEDRLKVEQYVPHFSYKNSLFYVHETVVRINDPFIGQTDLICFVDFVCIQKRTINDGSQRVSGIEFS